MYAREPAFFHSVNTTRKTFDLHLSQLTVHG
jgi:hypothetical protein